MMGKVTESALGKKVESLTEYHLLVAFVLLLALVPLGTTEILLLKLSGALFFAVFVMSWDLTSGYTGELSFGHSVFFAVGGYTTGMLNVHYGVDPLLGIVLGGIAAGIAGLLIGIPTLRLSGPYFSLVTLVVPLALLELFAYAREWTGGRNGLIGVESITYDPLQTYYISLAVFAGALGIFILITRSNVGNVFTAIRESEDVVVASGLNPAKFKIYAFTISGVVGGAAAAVFVHTPVGTTTPSILLALVVNINVILAAIVGGMGTITASMAGGIFFYMVRDYIAGLAFSIPIIGVSVARINTLLFLVMLLVVLFYIPNGLFVWLYERVRENLTGKSGEDKNHGQTVHARTAEPGRENEGSK